jgi:hypothetical protein
MRAVFVAVLFLLVATNAHATPFGDFTGGPPGETLPVREQPTYEAPAPEQDQLAALAASDAMSDRAFGRSTAVGLLPGQFDISTRTVVEHGSMVSFAAGVSRLIELSADFGYARTVGDTEGVAIKFTLLRRGTWAMAIDSGFRSTNTESVRSTTLSSDFRITTCPFDCNMLLTIAVGLSLTGGDVNNGDGGPHPLADISMIFAKGLVRPLIEAMTLDGDTNMAFAGLRIGGRHVGVDIGAGVLDVQYGSTNVGMMLGVGVRP